MVFRRVRDFVLVALVACCLLSVVPTKLADELGVAFPEWTGIGNHRSQLEGRNYAAPPKASMENIAEGKFQAGAEKYLSDVVPMRDNVLLANAALQRTCIKAANVPLGFECYPTFFGSNYVVVPEKNAVLRTVRGPMDNVEEAVDNIIGVINEISKARPDIRIVVQVIIDTYISDRNPTYQLVSNKYDMRWFEAWFSDKLTDDALLLYDEIASSEDLYSSWYNSDHHWRTQRAGKAYVQLGNSLGWSNCLSGSEQEVIPAWYGASARNGLMLDWADSLNDYPRDYSMLKCVFNGQSRDRGNLEKYWRGEDPSFSTYNGYGSYYGPAGEARYTHTNPTNKKTCLFVHQSYGDAIERDVALNYAITVGVDPFNASIGYSLKEYIDERNPDDIVFQFGVVDLPKVLRNSPDFFGYE